MDSPAPFLDFAAIGHQDSWNGIVRFINGIRTSDQEQLTADKIRQVVSFIPPRDIFRIKARSTTGIEINGVYIETFIDPDRLEAQFTKANIHKVRSAVAHATKMGCQLVTLGGFTSIVLEGNLGLLPESRNNFTTGNTLTTAFIVKGVEKAASAVNKKISESTILVIGATGDIGSACVAYFKGKAGKLLLCARNMKRLERLANQLKDENIAVDHAVDPDLLIAGADIVISAASSSGIDLNGLEKEVIICDAGYPKNLDARLQHNSSCHLFHGGMGQVQGGFSFTPDYSECMYRYPAENVGHGCLLESVVLAFEKKYENYSSGKGNITPEKIEEIYQFSLKHGITLAPFFNTNGILNLGASKTD